MIKLADDQGLKCNIIEKPKRKKKNKTIYFLN